MYPPDQPLLPSENNNGGDSHDEIGRVAEDDIDTLPNPLLAVTDAKKRAYLVALCTTPSTRIARDIGQVSQKTVWNWKHKAEANPDLPESKAYLTALAFAKEQGLIEAENEAWERATCGWKEPVFGNISEPTEIERADGKGVRIVWRQRTGVVGEITKKSDTMLIFMLKGGKPEVYRERFEHTGANGAPLQLQIVLPDNGRPRRLPSGDGEA